MRCATLWRRVVPAIGGRWIAYSAAQVAARRAAQMVLVTTCTVVPVPAHGPVPWPELPPWQPVALVPMPLVDMPAVVTSEPAGWAIMAVALLALWGLR